MRGGNAPGNQAQLEQPIAMRGDNLQILPCQALNVRIIQ
jgi:hypothetical protein